MSNTIDSQILSNRARAERASVSAAASEDVAVQAKDQSMAALADVLSTAGVDADYISYTVGEYPNSSGASEGTIGAYFKEEGLFQKVEWDGSAWVEIGEPIVSRKYVDDKASLLTGRMDDIEQAQSAGVIGYGTKAEMGADTSKDTGALAMVTNDPASANNGWYRWNGSEWVESAGFFSAATVKGWVASEAFDVSNMTFSSAGNIQSADLLWPDGEAGTISDLEEDSQGRISSLRFNRPGSKYITMSIAYDGDDVESIALTAAGW